MAAADETMMTVTWMARLAAIPSTRHKSRECSWLRRVSICVRVEEPKMATYQCHLGHLSTTQNARTDLLGINVNVEGSSSKPQKSAKCKKSKGLTGYAPEWHSHAETPQSIA